MTDEPSGAKVYRLGVFGALGVLTVAVAAAALYSMRGVLVQAFIAVFLAVSLDPAVRWLIRHRIKRPLAVTIVWLTFLGALAALAWIFVPPLVSQANALTTDFPGYVDHLRQTSPELAAWEQRFGLRERVDQIASDLPDRLGGEVLGFGRRFLGAVLSVLVVAVLTTYLMLDLTRLRRGLVRLFPRRHRVQAGEVINVLIDKVGAYMIGNIVISIIAGTAALIAFLALGVPFALPLAVLVALTDLIPLIGATLGAAVCVVVALATGDVWPRAILLAAFFVVYQQLENHFIAPRVLRDTVKISSLAVLFAALVGASALGLIGALMAIPIAAAAKVVIGARMRARDEAEENAEMAAEEAKDDPEVAEAIEDGDPEAAAEASARATAEAESPPLVAHRSLNVPSGGERR